MLDFAALGQPPLHFVLDRQAGIVAGELQNIVDPAKKILRLLGGGRGFRRRLGGSGALARGRLVLWRWILRQGGAERTDEQHEGGELAEPPHKLLRNSNEIKH